MQTSTFKTILAASLAFFVIACNNNKSKKETKQDEVEVGVTQLDTSIAEEPPPPPPPKTDPPQVEMKKAFAKKCFKNEGLKATITIQVIYTSDSTISGTVSSMGSADENEKISDFEGTVKENIYSVSFKKDPPLIGDASEWTKKGWKLETKNGKEVLRIVFNAKNYHSNKWKNMDYEFELADCK